jgi:hypothetical protein
VIVFSGFRIRQEISTSLERHDVVVIVEQKQPVLSVFLYVPRECFSLCIESAQSSVRPSGSECFLLKWCFNRKERGQASIGVSSGMRVLYPTLTLRSRIPMLVHVVVSR